jgi:hypothetical protein
MVNGLQDFVAMKMLRKYAPFLLTIAGSAVIFYSFTQTRLVIGNFGIISSFPLSFFGGLALLTMAACLLWTSGCFNQKLAFSQLMLLRVSIWIIPLLIGAQPPTMFVAYNALGCAEAVRKAGHLVPVWYQEYPLTWLLYVIIVQVIGVGIIERELFLVPFVVDTLYLIPLFVFLRNLCDNKLNIVYAGMWLFSLADWLDLSYIYPQSFAFILLLFILSILIKWRKQYSMSCKILVYLFILALVTTHFYTSLCLLAAIFLLHLQKERNLGWLIWICLLSISLWMFYSAIFYVELAVSSLLTIKLFNLGELLFRSLAPTFTSSQAHSIIGLSRIGTASVFLALALGGLLMGGRKLKMAERDILYYLIGLAIITLAFGPLYGPGAYRLESLDRLYFYSLPGTVYFCTKLMGRRATSIILCIALIVLVPLNMVSHYGNQMTDRFTTSQIAGSRFVADKGNQRLIIGGYAWQYFIPDLRTFTIISVFDENYEDFIQVPPKDAIIVISDLERNVMDYVYNRRMFLDLITSKMNNDSSYIVVYSSSHFLTFYKSR